MLKDGLVHARGKPEEVITEQNISEVYGVRSEILEGRDGMFVHVLEDDCLQ
jgi:iron complex transport system ATP-binding protein